MTVTIELISFSVSLTVLLGVLQFLVSLWIKSRLEQSIKHEYDQKLEDYKFGIMQREQAARVAELLAAWIKFSSAQAEALTDEQKKDHFEHLNRLTWELAIWIPDELLVRALMKRLNNGSNAVDIKEIILQMRELVLNKKSDLLIWQELIDFH